MLTHVDRFVLLKKFNKINSNMDMECGKECEKPMISELNGGSKRMALQSPCQSDSELTEPIVYDYMKYANKKKNKSGHADAKNKKCVSFKRVVEMVTFSEDWKMKTSESSLHTEDDQLKCTSLRRNF